MKTQNKFKLFSLLLISFVIMTACEKDGEKIYLSELGENELVATSDKVVLSQENANEQVLSFSWSAQALTVSNPDMKAPNIISTIMQVSTQQDFTSNVTETAESNLSKSYSGTELNTVAKNLGLAPDVATPLYFRLKSSVGNNMEPVYSNVLTVNITSYFIDMSVGFILDENKTDTGFTLYSPASDGVYTGFMGATSWYNFFMKEGDGTVWGNNNDDAANGPPFLLLTASDSWKCWFPGQGGCYYVIMDTKKKEWSSLFLPKLTVSGDISGDMTFDRPNVKWTYTFTAASTNPIKIKIGATGSLYNLATGTDDAAAISTPLAFAQQGETVVLAQSAGDITVTVPAAGECTLTLDLSNPKSWTCSVVSGSTTPVETPKYLYAPGISDGSGNWTFNNFLTLYDENNLAYAGVFNVDAPGGYTLNIEKDNWGDKYALAEGDASGGTLAFQSDTNIPAPDAGLYLIDASLKGLTYNLTSVGSEIYVGGLNKGPNDTWDFNTVLPATATPGVYSGEVTINFASAWGFKIYLVANDWVHFFGGSSGQLYYNGNGITDDASLSIGTHQLTVDLIQGTYEIN